MTFEESLLALLGRHCGWLKVQVGEIRTLVAAGLVERHRPDPSLMRALDLVHQIKGTSGSMGYIAVSEAAATFESHLKGILEHDLDRADRERAIQLLADLEAIAAASEPERSTLYAAAAS